MDDLTRRAALQRSAALAGTLLTTTPAVVAAPADDPPAPKAEPKRPTDRDFVIAAGMTPEEADCWALVAKAAGAFFALPEQHPMDRGEVASAIHIVQNKLLARPTYRRYLERAKAAAGQTEETPKD